MLGSELIPYLLAGLVFVVVIVVFAAIGRRMEGSAPEVDDRLSQFAGRREEKTAQKARTIDQIDAVVGKGERGNQTRRDLARADLKLTVTEFYLIKFLAACVGAAFGAFLGRASNEAMLLTSIVGFVLVSFAPNLYVGYAAGKRVSKFNAQLGDTISMMANSLRSGYSLLQSMELVSREAPQPTAAEYRRVVQEVGLGLSTEAALDNLLKRVPSDDLDLLITAVNIQMESGGNLAQILDTIGHTIRERIRIKGEIQVLTAQGRISAYVITGLPIVLAIMITVINPTYMSPIFTFGLPPDAWCCLPLASGVMIMVGFFAIMKIVDIEV
ncbi:MAG TPA: type II secretion system F family protein [Roseiflexaceae bacterium]|nr:type II secretion system F family protein [Roseiflexaceae bacterium]HMP39346.1 type II secretion system F family protein [Roseiflexaceae bacterium]